MLKTDLIPNNINRFLTYYEENNNGLSCIGLVFVLDNLTNEFICYTPFTSFEEETPIKNFTETLNYCIKLDSSMSKIFRNLDSINDFNSSSEVSVGIFTSFIANSLGTSKIIVPIDIMFEDFPDNYSIFLTYAYIDLFKNEFHLGDNFVNLASKSLISFKQAIYSNLIDEFKSDIEKSIINQAKNYSHLFNNLSNNISWNFV